MTTSWPARALLAPIRFYQRFISPALPASCRYYPTCSSYAVGALQTHGALRGSWLAVRRLGRCHPWHEGGYDPVPPARERRAVSGSSVNVNHVCCEPAGTEIDATLAADAVDVPTDAQLASAEAPNPRSNAA